MWRKKINVIINITFIDEYNATQHRGVGDDRNWHLATILNKVRKEPRIAWAGLVPK
jgi:hypothetical protein